MVRTDTPAVSSPGHGMDPQGILNRSRTLTPPPPRRTFHPLVESLEHRTLLASQLNASLVGSTLKIEGTENPDQIIVRQSNGRIAVDGLQIAVGTSRVASVAASQVAKIEIRSLGGNDVISLAHGSEAIRIPSMIDAGAGDDVVWGGEGADVVYGGSGHDWIDGRGGNDTLYGMDGNDALLGGTGDDYLDGGNGNDSLYGMDGHDTLSGGAGNDHLNGGAGRDAFYGGTGFDTYQDDFDLSRPAPSGYQAADIEQQQGYTCQTLAALAAYARTGADLGRQITYLGNYQYDVKLFENGSWITQRVAFNGLWNDNDPAPPPAAGSALPDFWTILFQRARLSRFGIDTSKEMSASTWSALNVQSGYRLFSASDALQAFSGRNTTLAYASQATPQALRDALAQGKAVVLNTNPAGRIDASSGLIGWHSYAVMKVWQEGATWKLQLYNPWGQDGTVTKDGINDGMVTITWAQYTASVSTYATA